MTKERAATDARATLAQQQAYYRAVAAQYDREYRDAVSPLRYAARALDFIDVRGDVVELACGTGQWSRVLQPKAASLTCVDGAPDMLRIAAGRVGAAVEFINADIYRWRPDRRFDTAFFAFWLSHVPWRRWPAFWRAIESVIKPGGVVGVVDETAEAVSDKEDWTANPDVVTRRLSDGRRFDIIKLRLEPDDVVRRLGRLGWAAQVDLIGPGLFALRATLASTDRG